MLAETTAYLLLILSPAIATHIIAQKFSMSVIIENLLNLF
jgi:hypothetical protein